MALPDSDSSVGHSFGLGLDGVTIRFAQVSGLRIEQDVIETKQTAPDGTYVITRLPGRPKPGDVTLTRGLTEDGALAALVRDAQVRPAVAVTIVGADGGRLRSFTLRDAWPSKLEIGAGGDPSVLLEKLTITYAALEVD